MIKFIDRTGSNLNQKILEVNQVERDESGEIVRLYVKEIRNDQDGLTNQGTALNATELNKILDSLYQEIIMQDSERVSLDIQNLNIPAYLYESFLLPETGEKGSHILWEVTTGTGIKINGNQAVIERKINCQYAVLQAKVSFNSAYQMKTFSITIPSFDISFDTTPSDFNISWTQKIGFPNSTHFHISCPIELSNLYLEVEAIDLLKVEITHNNSIDLEFILTETDELNQTKTESSKTITLPFKVKIYDDSSKNYLVKEYDANINYTYQKSVVVD